MLYNVWKFHSSERMFQLKVVRTILEYMDVVEHPYSTYYRKFVQDLGIRTFWRSLITQFKFLLSEITSEALALGEIPAKLWVERNAREQIEILHCLMILPDFAAITLNDFDEVFQIFKSHGFGRQPACYESITYLDESTIEKIKFSEIALILCMADNFWSLGRNKYDFFSHIDNDMQVLSSSPEFCPIAYIWIIMHMLLPDCVELYSGKYSAWMNQILDHSVFDTLNKLQRHEMFTHDTMVGVNVRGAMYHLLLITCDKFNQNDSLLTHSGFLELLAELLKTPQIAKQYYQKFDAGLMTLWTYNLKYLPHSYNVVTTLAEALLLENHNLFRGLMKQLENIPFYNVVYNPDEDPEDRVLPSYLEESESSKSQFIVRRLFDESSDGGMRWFLVKYHDDTLVRYMKYTNLFNELFEMFNSALVVGSNYSEDIPKMISGLKLTIIVLKLDPYIFNRCSVFRDILKACIHMLVKCGGEGVPPLHVLSLCINVLTESLESERFFILKEITKHKLMPYVLETEFDYVELMNRRVLHPGVVGQLILACQMLPDHQYLVRSYLEFLRTSIQVMYLLV